MRSIIILALFSFYIGTSGQLIPKWVELSQYQAKSGSNYRHRTYTQQIKTTTPKQVQPFDVRKQVYSTR